MSVAASIAATLFSGTKAQIVFEIFLCFMCLFVAMLLVGHKQLLDLATRVLRTTTTPFFTASQPRQAKHS